MKNRPLLIAIIVIGLLVIGGVGWYLVSPLFIDNTIDEAFPFEMPSAETIAAMSESEIAQLETDFMAALPSQAEIDEMPQEEMAALQEVAMEVGAAMPDKEMDDEMPEAADEWVVAGQGSFVDADSFHKGSGNATIYQQGEQSVLRFEEFSVTNGPDLHVILSKNPAPTSRSDIGEDYIDLGSLKGNMGNQNYEIPADIDLSDYQSIVIYCMPFHVVFSTATLG